MTRKKLQEYLIQIAENLKEGAVLEDVYEQLALLADIDESEVQVKQGEVFTQDEVEAKAKKWLK